MSVSASAVYETEFHAQFDSRLEGAIDELREKSDYDLADYKLQVEAVYKDKVQLKSIKVCSCSLHRKCDRYIEKRGKFVQEFNCHSKQLISIDLCTFISFNASTCGKSI